MMAIVEKNAKSSRETNYILEMLIIKQYSVFPFNNSKGDGLYAELSTDIHNFHIFCLFVIIFCTESGNGCLSMLLKGFFANINMKLKNPMDPSEGVVELAME